MSKIEKNRLEWCVFAMSLALVGSVLCYLTYHALFNKSTPPVLEVELGAAQRQAGYYEMPVTVHNRGDQTAEAVQIEVRLTKPDASHEQAGFEIQFVPPRSSRQGVVSFQTDPQTAKQLMGRAVGYQQP